MSLSYEWKIKKIKKYPSKTVTYESGNVTFNDYVCFIEGRVRCFDGTYDVDDLNTYVEKDFVLDWSQKPQNPPASESEYVSFADMTEENYINIVKNTSIYRSLEEILAEKYHAKCDDGIPAEVDNPFNHDEFVEYDPTSETMQETGEESNTGISTSP